MGLPIKPFLLFLHASLDDMGAVRLRQLALVQSRSWTSIFWIAASEISFCSAKVTKVSENMRVGALGVLGTIGESLYNFLYLPGIDKPAIVNDKSMLRQIRLSRN